MSIACYNFGCKDAVETCRIYWLGQIEEKLCHAVPEYLSKNCSVDDLKAYLEEEMKKCKNSTPSGQTNPYSNSAPGCPADAGTATQSLSAAGPASLEAEQEATPFDYSGLDDATAEIMHSADSIMQQARRNYIFETARAVKMAHGALANHYGGTFGKWCESYGISHTTAGKLLDVCNLVANSTVEEQAVLEQASPSLLYAAAKPSAPADLVQGVKDGDITTHKQYKELEAQVKAERDAREKAEQEAQRLREDSEQARAAAHEYHVRAENAESGRAALLDQQGEYIAHIHELEARPIDVAVQEPDPAEVERRAAEKAETMTAQLRGELKTAQHNIRQMQERTQSLLDQLENARNASVSQQLPSPDEAFETAFPMAKDFAGGIRTYHKTFLMVAPGLSPVDLKTCAQLMIDAAQDMIAGLRAVMTLPEPVEGDEDFD